MATAFGPIGNSDIISITAASQRFALGTLAASNPAVRLIALNASQQAWYLKFGDNTVTVSVADGMRAIPASQDAPIVLPVPTGATHVAILAEGATGDAQLSYGGFREGQFLPLGASSTTAITQTDQRIALPALESVNPCIRLVSRNPSITSLRVKLGDGAVTGTLATSMRVAPGSVENPTHIPVTAGQTHLAIFCEGVGGDVVLTGGGLRPADISSSDVLFSAGPRILARDSGAGPGQERTISQVLDYLGTPAQGDLIYRGAATWDNLAAGAAGQFLQSQGAGANPQWAAVVGGVTLLTSGSVAAAASLDIVFGAWSAYRALLFTVSSFVPVTDDVELRMRFSTNGGVSYDAGASDYSRAIMGIDDNGSSRDAGSIGTGIILAGDASAAAGVSNVAAEGGANCEIMMQDFTAAGRWPAIHFRTRNFIANSRTAIQVGAGSREAAQDTDAVQFLFETGNIASGNYAVYGMI